MAVGSSRQKDLAPAGLDELDPQLARFAAWLKEAGVRYWVDAGTLLALVREGRLFASDKDVDLGVWSDDLDKLGAVLERERAAGRRVARESWRGRPFKFKVHPRAGEEGRVLDVQVFRLNEGSAWSMAHTIGDYVYRWFDVPLVARGAFRWPWRMWHAHRARDVEVTRFPWKYMGWLGTWIVPEGFLRQLDEKNAFGLPFPKDVDAYLTYRYGDWRTPRGEWVYWEHDGAYRRGPPDLHLSL